MIDIHSHILSGIDDGARSSSESIMMAKIAVDEGIHTIIATPHYIKGQYEITKQEVLNKVSKLNQLLIKEEIPLNVLPGHEIRINSELIKDYQRANSLSLNDAGSYLLLELPYDHVPRYTEQLLYDIQFEGLTPIIAHPERNAGFIENADLLYNLVRKGALTQITAGSLTGVFGRKTKKFSHLLVEANLTHFIASDAHNVSNRVFNMSKAFSTIQNKYGIDYVDYFLHNAEFLIQKKSVYINEPHKIKQRKMLGFF